MRCGNIKLAATLSSRLPRNKTLAVGTAKPSHKTIIHPVRHETHAPSGSDTFDRNQNGRQEIRPHRKLPASDNDTTSGSHSLAAIPID
jgi:hypothetical protein